MKNFLQQKISHLCWHSGNRHWNQMTFRVSVNWAKTLGNIRKKDYKNAECEKIKKTKQVLYIRSLDSNLSKSPFQLHIFDVHLLIAMCIIFLGLRHRMTWSFNRWNLVRWWITTVKVKLFAHINCCSQSIKNVITKIFTFTLVFLSHTIQQLKKFPLKNFDWNRKFQCNLYIAHTCIKLN